MLCVLHQRSFMLVYPVLPGLYMTLYWIGGEARNKNRTALGGARTILPSSKAEEEQVGRKNQELQASQCPTCSVDHQDWSWALLLVPPEGSPVAKHWTQAFLGCYTCQQWSHRVQLSPPNLPCLNDFKEAR